MKKLFLCSLIFLTGCVTNVQHEPKFPPSERHFIFVKKDGDVCALTAGQNAVSLLINKKNDEYIIRSTKIYTYGSTFKIKLNDKVHSTSNRLFEGKEAKDIFTEMQTAEKAYIEVSEPKERKGRIKRSMTIIDLDGISKKLEECNS